MKYKIVFLDIDGTILKPDHTYTTSTKDAISQLQHQGIDVFLATGRPLHEIKDLTLELNVDSFIGYNGAYAIYKNEKILNEPISRGKIERFIKISQEHNHEIVFYTSNKNYYTTLDHPLVKQFNESYSLKQNELITENVMDKILSLTVMNVAGSETNLYQLDDDIRISQVHGEGSEHAYDILHHQVNKGTAVNKVLQYLKIAKEQSIAFGDGLNDKEMFESVGESFAMANSHPKLFPFAKYRTSSVIDSGIFNGLNALGLVR